jgi:hypothetical protein
MRKSYATALEKVTFFEDARATIAFEWRIFRLSPLIFDKCFAIELAHCSRNAIL